MKSHLLLGGRPSVSGRSCNKRMVVHCDDKLSRGNADFGRILVRFYSFVCQGCDSFCVGFFLISESCMLVHHGKIVQGAYGLITPRSLKNLPAKTLLSNHIWLKLALPTSFTILLVHHFTIHLNNCSPFESKTLSTASAFFHFFSISIPPAFTGQHSKRREFCLLIFHMIRDLPAISWSPQFGCFTMEDPCKTWNQAPMRVARFSRRFRLGTHITKHPLWFLGTAAW